MSLRRHVGVLGASAGTTSYSSGAASASAMRSSQNSSKSSGIALTPRYAFSLASSVSLTMVLPPSF